MAAQWTFRSRLTIWYLGVLGLATALVAGGSWYLMRRSLAEAADAHLRMRMAGVEQVLANWQKDAPAEDITDELHEYVQLTMGDVLLEVVDEQGRVLCQPTLTGWQLLRAAVAGRPIGAPPLLLDVPLDSRPFRAAAARAAIGSGTFEIVAALPMGSAREALTRFGWTIAALVPIVLAVAGVGGYVISGRALAPVDRMTRDAQAMTVESLHRRLDVPGPEDELRRLATTFNDMLARLESGVADMARFTADAAHELRTPVTLVRTTAEIALARERSSLEYRQSLLEVQKLSEQMSLLVGDLLDLARADAGVETRETRPVDLDALIRDVMETARPAAAQRQQSLTFRAPSAAIHAVGNPAALRRMLLILLDNAVKYTPRSGAVVVTVREDGGGDAPTAVLEVADTGPGIDPAERTRVFDRFFRGARARQQVSEGAGLGLSIAQVIVRRHDGTITVDAGPGGQGCRVTVRLPRA